VVEVFRSEEKGEDDKSRRSLVEVERLNVEVFLEMMTMPLLVVMGGEGD
jgi:hypothetical protein